MRTVLVPVLLVSAVALGGCTPAPAPKPTPTPLFASEAEAYRAAEKVYRDYAKAANDAQNGGQSYDPKSYLTGEALDQDIRSDRDFEAAGLKIVGTTVVKKFSPKDFDVKAQVVIAGACVDVSMTRVIDSHGVDRTPDHRPSIVALTVRLVASAGAIKIIEMSASAEACD